LIFCAGRQAKLLISFENAGDEREQIIITLPQKLIDELRRVGSPSERDQLIAELLEKHFESQRQALRENLIAGYQNLAESKIKTS